MIFSWTAKYFIPESSANFGSGAYSSQEIRLNNDKLTLPTHINLFTILYNVTKIQTNITRVWFQIFKFL